MNVVGLDLSLSGTGVADIFGNTCTIKSDSKEQIEPRLWGIWSEIEPYVEIADYVIIEGLAFGSKTGKAAERGGLHFIVRTQIWLLDIPMGIMAPTARAKYAAGKSVDKDGVLLAAAKWYPDGGFTNNNECDAYILRAAALDHFGEPIVDLPKAHRDALEKVEW